LLKAIGLIKFVLLYSIIYYQQITKKLLLASLDELREFKTISFEINNIVSIICTYKKDTLAYDDSIDNDLIKTCLQNNTDPIMRFNSI
jgi:hypothetical protein